MENNKNRFPGGKYLYSANQFNDQDPNSPVPNASNYPNFQNSYSTNQESNSYKQKQSYINSAGEYPNSTVKQIHNSSGNLPLNQSQEINYTETNAFVNNGIRGVDSQNMIKGIRNNSYNNCSPVSSDIATVSSYSPSPYSSSSNVSVLPSSSQPISNNVISNSSQQPPYFPNQTNSSNPHSYNPRNVSVPSSNKTNYLQSNEMPPPQNNLNYYEKNNYPTMAMAGLSVREGFSKLWGSESVNLLQDRNILPPFPEPVDKESPNCDPSVFCCTLNNIPENQSLLQKSRLPFGVLVHPFKDIEHLSVVQCGTIVRCRSCRTYINPFVTFVDQRRWKCNLCFRINDLPEDFLIDPFSKTYGDPSRRPEVRNSTIEFIAPSEYMLRPPQPAIYLFLLDVSQLAIQSGYLRVFCQILKDEINNLPGDSRTQIGFITFNSTIHFYELGSEQNQPKMLVISDIDDIFIPTPENLLVNLEDSKSFVIELLDQLPKMFENSVDSQNALGAALQAAYKLTSTTGGRVTVMQSSLPNFGPGSLKVREDPNQRASKTVPSSLLGPGTDFYKKLALDCSGDQVAVDFFLLSSQYSDLATLACITKYSAGCLYYYPSYSSCSTQKEKYTLDLQRYLTRKIGFEAVMRIRCTRGLSIHTFHGNCFVRSSDLLSLANINPDYGFAMQISIDESLADIKTAGFQTAVLYTSSKGERRIRVHSMSFPVVALLGDVFSGANQKAIIGLIAKMAVDRTLTATLIDAREALIHSCIDLLATYHQILPAAQVAGALVCPISTRLIPLLVNALLKHTAFRVNISTKLDDRVFAMEQMKTLPLNELIAYIYPPLYALSQPNFPQLQLSCEKLDSHQSYLLATFQALYVYKGNQALDSQIYQHFLKQNILTKTAPIIEINESSSQRQIVLQHMVDDRTESNFSYYEFLQHLKTQIEK